jgi:hypothetical protein
MSRIYRGSCTQIMDDTATTRQIMTKWAPTSLSVASSPVFDDDLPAIDGADQGYVEYQLSRAEWEPASRQPAT